MNINMIALIFLPSLIKSAQTEIDTWHLNMTKEWFPQITAQAMWGVGGFGKIRVCETGKLTSALHSATRHSTGACAEAMMNDDWYPGWRQTAILFNVKIILELWQIKYVCLEDSVYWFEGISTFWTLPGSPRI